MINDLQNIAMARVIADSAKIGLPGVIAAVAGLSIIKGLFAKFSKGKNDVTSAPNFNKTRVSSYQASGSQNMTFVLKGQDIYGSLSNFQRNNRFTTTG